MNLYMPVIIVFLVITQMNAKLTVSIFHIPEGGIYTGISGE